MKDIANKVDSVDTLPANAFNSIASELENVVTDSGQTLDATAETDPDPTPTQISRAITEGALSADFYTDSGAADAYILTTAGGWRQPTAYVTGMSFRFVPDNANTGASTVNISGLGVKSIKQADGTALLGGQLPAVNSATIYYDGTDFILIEAGGAGGGLGGVNLLEDEANAASGVGNWVSSGSTLAVSQEISTIPLNGVRDTAIKLTIGGTPSAGDYQAIRFTMSTSLKDLLLGIKWFQTVSAYTVDALKVELYYNAASDYTGAYTEVPLSSDVSGDTFVPDSDNPVSNITYMEGGNDYYELRFVVGSAAVGNEIIYINDLETGPGNIESGAAIGPWIAYTPSNTQGLGTITSVTTEYRKNGEDIEIRGGFTVGTTTASELQIELPTGLTIGGISAGAELCGVIGTGNASANPFTAIATKGDTYINAGMINTSVATISYTPQLATDITGSTRMSIKAKMPIAEWKNQGVQHQLSNDLISSNARMRAERTNSSTISTTDTVIFEDTTNDPLSAYNSTTGIYTTKSAGEFKVMAMTKFTAVTTAVSVLSIKKNGTIVASRATDTSAIVSMPVEDTLTCAKDDTIEIAWAGDATSQAFSLTAADNILTIERVADYSSRQPTGFGLATADFAGLVTSTGESFDEYTTSGTSLTTTALTPVGSTYTVVKSGKYLINSFATFDNADSAATSARVVTLDLQKDGTSIAQGIGTIVNVTSNEESAQVAVSRVIDLVAGEVIGVDVSSSISNVIVVRSHGLNISPVSG